LTSVTPPRTAALIFIGSPILPSFGRTLRVDSRPDPGDALSRRSRPA
jgi:hypothetical protein